MTVPTLPPTGGIDAHGWLQDAGALLQPSPNVDARPDAADPTLLVIHNISLPPGEFGTGQIAALFSNTLDTDAHPYFALLRGLKVSAHFLIDRDGHVTQFVSTLARAWHAGVSSFAGRTRCNDFSIGIELEGTDDDPFTPAQYATLARVTHAVRARHAIDAIVGHADIAPGRKTDPGPFFDWQTYRRQAQLPLSLTPFAAS